MGKVKSLQEIYDERRKTEESYVKPEEKEKVGISSRPVPVTEVFSDPRKILKGSEMNIEDATKIVSGILGENRGGAPIVGQRERDLDLRSKLALKAVETMRDIPLDIATAPSKTLAKTPVNVANELMKAGEETEKGNLIGGLLGTINAGAETFMGALNAVPMMAMFTAGMETAKKAGLGDVTQKVMSPISTITKAIGIEPQNYTEEQLLKMGDMGAVLFGMKKVNDLAKGREVQNAVKEGKIEQSNIEQYQRTPEIGQKTAETGGGNRIEKGGEIKIPEIKNAGEAIKLGRSIEGNPEAIKVLEDTKAQKQQEAQKAQETYKQTKTDVDFDIAQQKTLDAQLANEAYDRATGKMNDKGEYISSEGLTGITQTDINKSRNLRGVELLEKEASQTWGEDWNKANKQIETKEIDPVFLEKDIVKNKRTPNSIEEAALAKRRIDLEKEYDVVYNQLKNADEGTKAQAKSRLAVVEDALDVNDKALFYGGAELGRALNFRKILIQEDASLARNMQRAKVANNGKELPENIKTGLESTIKDLQNKIKEYETYTDKIVNEKVQTQIDQFKVENIYEQRKAKRTYTKQELKAERSDLYKELYKITSGQASANPFANPEALKIVAKLTKNLVNEGYLTAEALVDAMAKELKDIFGDINKRDLRDAISKYGINPENRRSEISKQIADVRSQATLISKIEDLQSGKEVIKKQSNKTTPSETLIELQEKYKEELNKNKIDKNSPEAKLENRKKALTKQLESLRDEVEIIERTKQIPESKKREGITLDEEGNRIRADIEKLRERKNQIINRIKYDNRNLTEKALDYAVKWRRAVILSSVNTIGKLTSAALGRTITTPIEEAIGSGINKIPYISKIAEKAPREGGSLNVKAEAKALSQFFERATYRDIRDVAKTGKSSLDYLYGKKSDLPPEALEFFGHLHGALKVTPKRAEFFRSLEKRAESALRNGEDITNPEVQARLGAESYVDANRAILMNNNAINDLHRQILGALRNKGLGGKIAGATTQILLPIVKVPTNYMIEASSYAIGGLKALVKVIANKGVENLTPEQADYVIRALKKQTIGGAVMLLGYLNADNVGGYYQYGEKREKGDVKAGGLRIFGVDVPKFMVHTPVLEMLQIGATLRRVQDSYDKKRKEDGLISSVWKAGMGLAKQTPFIDQPARVLEAVRSAETASNFAGDLVSSMTIPPDVARIAAQIDKNDKGETQKRYAEGFIENIQKNIPALREDLPKTKKKKWR